MSNGPTLKVVESEEEKRRKKEALAEQGRRAFQKAREDYAGAPGYFKDRAKLDSAKNIRMELTRLYNVFKRSLWDIKTKTYDLSPENVRALGALLKQAADIQRDAVLDAELRELREKLDKLSGAQTLSPSDIMALTTPSGRSGRDAAPEEG